MALVCYEHQDRIRATTGFSSFVALLQLQLAVAVEHEAMAARCQPTGALGAPVGFSRGTSPVYRRAATSRSRALVTDAEGPR